MKNIKIIALTLLAIIAISCESNTYEEVSGVVANPTYAKNVQPIISANCVRCHNSSASSQSISLENYVDVKTAVTANALLCRIEGSNCGDVMPQSGRMPQTTIDLIKRWANQGFTN